MIKFAIRKRFVLKPDVTAEMLINVLRNKIDQVFQRKKFSQEDNKITLEGRLPSLWESCCISAQIQLNIEEGHIFCCQIEGDLSPEISQTFGCCMIAFLLATVVFAGIGVALGAVVVLVGVQLVEFACSYRRPERYLNEIIEAIQLKYGLP